MKIGIDISETTGERTGIGYYSTHLVEALADIDKDNRYTLYPVFYDNFPPTYRSARCPEQANFALFAKMLPPKLLTYLWHRSKLEKETLFGHQDILHSTTFSAPKLSRGALVVTIYDLSFWTHPECHRKGNIEYCAKRCCLAARNAKALIAISEATKRDIIRFLHVPEEKVVVTPLAAHHRFRPIKDRGIIHQTLMKHGIYTDYIFYLGSLEPRKNLETLIRAYARIPKALRDTVHLAIGGARGWKNSRVFSLIEQLGLSNHVIILGYVSEKELPVLYSSASVFVYPSLYEGFGLPALEAMACGAPVITSNTSSLPEVVEDAGLTTDPTDEVTLAEMIACVLKDSGLNEELRERGLEQAKKFSWRKTAELTLELYRKVAGS